MKSKATLVLLLVVTVGIWGYVVFKIMNATRDDVTSTKYGKNISTRMINTDTIKESKILLLNYADPFLRNLSRPQTVGILRKLAPQKQTSVNWPKITYLGSIKNDKQSRVAILVIDNKEVFIPISKTLNGIKVVKIYSDSVMLKLEKQTRTVLIN